MWKSLLAQLLQIAIPIVIEKLTRVKDKAAAHPEQ